MEYCERCGPGLLDEPINASTNVAFFIAAWGAWLLAKHRQRLSTGIWMLIGLAVSIGIGSGLWHTFATPWAEALDRIPILIFQLVFLWLYIRGIMSFRLHLAAAFITGFVLIGFLATLLPPILDRSLNFYGPALLLLVGLSIYHYRRCKRERLILLAAAGVFLLAILFRSIDLLVCSYVPIGTHFLWHILNGFNVYLAMRSLIVSQEEKITV